MRTFLAFIALCAVASKLGGQAAGHYAEQSGLAELRRVGGAFHVDRIVEPAPQGDPWRQALASLQANNLPSLMIFC